MNISKINTFSGHNDCVYTLTEHKDPAKFFSGAGDGMVALWDLEEQDKGILIAKLSTSVYALNYLAAQNVLLIGQNYQGIHLADVESKKEVGSLKLTKSAIFDIQTYGDLAFVGTGEGEIIVVYLPNLTIVKRIKNSIKSARCIAINPLDKEFVVGYSDNTIRIFDLETYELKKSVSSHTNSVFTVAFSPDYRYLMTSGRDAHLKIWDVKNDYNLENDIVAHMYAINHIVFSSDGKYFCTCSMDKSIKIWDAEQFRLLKVIDKARYAGHGTSVNKLLWTSHRDLLISASDDRSISVWNLVEKEEFDSRR